MSAPVINSKVGLNTLPLPYSTQQIPRELFQDSGKEHWQAGFAWGSCIRPGTRRDSRRSQRHTVPSTRRRLADSSCTEIPYLGEHRRASKSSWNRKPQAPPGPEICRLYPRETQQEAFGPGLKPEHYTEPRPERLPTSERVFRQF